MKKRILFVIDSLHSGGAEKSLVSLLSLIDYKKFDVDLLLFKKEGLYLPLVPKEVRFLDVPEYFNDKNNNKIKIKIAKLKNSISIRNPYYKKIYHCAQITSKNILTVLEKQNKKYDIAIAYSQGLPTYYVVDKVEAIKKVCWINTDYKKAGYNSKFDKEYYEKYNFIVLVSEKNKEIFENIYPEFKEKLKIVYDIISKDLVTSMANKGEGYIDNFNGIRILTIGRHVELKGYDMAIGAAKILKEYGINFRWYSIGEGNLTKKLISEVEKNNLVNEFVFLGTYTNPYPFIKQCDIYCQPSRFEGFGMAIAEARILNKPIVATNFDIVYEQIRDNENGLISDMNVSSIAKNIEKLIKDKDLYQNLINNLKGDGVDTEYEINKIYQLIAE